MTAEVLAWPLEVTKKCRQCNEILPIDRFHLAKSNRDGRSNRCKECHSIAGRAWHAANPGYANEQGKRWREANRERYRAGKAADYLAKREEYSARNKAWRTKNSDGKRAADKAWRIANSERKRKNDKDWRLANAERLPAVKRGAYIKRKYGISPEQYAEMLGKQGGRCAICGGLEPGGFGGQSFAVDHDHVTLKVRGLLCFSCNTGLGHFKDNAELLRRALEYLD